MFLSPGGLGSSELSHSILPCSDPRLCELLWLFAMLSALSVASFLVDKIQETSCVSYLMVHTDIYDTHSCMRGFGSLSCVSGIVDCEGLALADS